MILFQKHATLSNITKSRRMTKSPLSRKGRKEGGVRGRQTGVFKSDADRCSYESVFVLFACFVFRFHI